MAKQTAPKDLFLNFAGLTLPLDAVDSSVLVELKLNTGLSIRGALIWLVHMIEWYTAAAEVDYNVLAVLCTRQGLATMPALNDDGVIAVFRERGFLTTSGFEVERWPHVNNYLPPIPLASPQLSLYAQTVSDVAVLQGKDVECRMGFTTAPLDAAAYTEIAEAWGW